MYGQRKAIYVQPTTKSTQELSSLTIGNFKVNQKQVLKFDWPVLRSAHDIDINLKQFMLFMRSISNRYVSEEENNSSGKENPNKEQNKDL